jgi:hypothetical protein
VARVSGITAMVAATFNILRNVYLCSVLGQIPESFENMNQLQQHIAFKQFGEMNEI